MSIQSILETAHRLYSTCSSYVLGPDGYHSWMDQSYVVLCIAWPAFAVAAVGLLALVVVRVWQWATRRAYDHSLRLGEVRPIFNSSTLPGKRMPLVYDPGGFKRRDETGRWR